MSTNLQNTNPVLPFDPRMAYDFALGLETPRNIIAQYGVSPDEYELLRTHPQFRLAVDKYVTELKEKGITFRMKAALQAEALLPEAYRMSVDANTPASVRADLIKWQAKVGNLEPKETKGEAVSALQININLG